MIGSARGVDRYDGGAQLVARGNRAGAGNAKPKHEHAEPLDHGAPALMAAETPTLGRRCPYPRPRRGLR